MKLKKKIKIKSFKELKGFSFGVGGNTVNPNFPNAHRSVMAKDVRPKSNVQTMFFNDSIPSR